MTPYYNDAGITIYHGDCRDVLPGLKGIGLVLTDPPYAKSGSRAEWKVTASVAIGLHQAARLVPKGGAMLCEVAAKRLSAKHEEPQSVLFGAEVA